MKIVSSLIVSGVTATRLCSILLLAFMLSQCSSTTPPPATVSHVDLPRYMGDWHVIAHIPYALEKGKVGTIDRYVMRPDGRIDNIFLFRKETLDAPLEQWKGIAWVHNTETNAEWRVRIIWPFVNSYLILDLDKDYQWSAVGLPSKKLAWILARDPSLPESTYNRIVKQLAEKGYDTAKLVKVPQRTKRY